jgi:O-antigen/teichoic acid export membrane protein
MTWSTDVAAPYSSTIVNDTHPAPQSPSLGIPARRALLGSLASGVVGQTALVATGIVAARTLGPTDRGYLALLILVPTVLQLAGNLGLPLATTYFIASDRSHEQAVLRAIRRPIVLQIAALTLLQGAILWLLVQNDPHRVELAAALTLPLIVAGAGDLYGRAILQGQARYTAFNILRNAIVGFYLVGVALLVVLGRTELVGFAIAWTIASLAAGAVTAGVALAGRARVAQSSDVVTSSHLLRFGLRGYLASLSPVTTFRLDQALIGLFLAPKELGLYVAALSFTTLPDLISRGVGMIALPHVAGTDVGRRRAESRSFVLFSTVTTAVVVVVLEVSAGWLIPFFFGSEFEDAVPITRILLVGSFLWGIRRVLSDSASGAGRPGLASAAELASWITVVPAVAVLLPLWQAEGVAVAMAIASATSLLVLALLVRRSDRRGREPQFRPAQLIDSVD